jgi:hypothetical protein
MSGSFRIPLPSPRRHVSTIAPEPKVWIDRQTWREPEERLEQPIETTSLGSPPDPTDAGRLAVDAHSEDLRRLAES